jgi:RNA polymerase sigma-70 factor, ECF subfamily
MAKGNLLSSLFSMTDEQAMWRVQTQDDHRAFDHIVERWEEPIYRLCARMTGDSHRGEDLKQETFARLFEKRRDYRPGARLSTWLWRIALNLCYDELRRRHRRGEESLENNGAESAGALREYLADEPAPDTHLAAREEGELVRRALLRLPEIYRSALVLRHYENLKLREIAEVLEIPDGTVNSRLAEGLAQLTRLLEPQFGRQRPESSPQERAATDARRTSGTCPDPPATANSARLLSSLAAKTNC